METQKQDEFMHKKTVSQEPQLKKKKLNEENLKSHVAASGGFFAPSPNDKIPAGYTRLTDKLSEQDKKNIKAEYKKIEKAQKNFSAY